MDKRYLIFERGAHPVVYFVQATDVTAAMTKYILELNPQASLLPNGSIQEGKLDYAHPLAYIEANDKIHYEWQIRELPDWAFQDDFVEAFCGENEYGVEMDIEECRAVFKRDFPRKRINVFIWYVKQGILATFYRKRGPFQIEVWRRYLIQFGQGTVDVTAWEGDYNQLAESLVVTIPRYRKYYPVERSPQH